jgi:hypothetical protein
MPDTHAVMSCGLELAPKPVSTLVLLPVTPTRAVKRKRLDKPCSCAQCGMTFKDVKYRRKHMKRKHGNQTTENETRERDNEVRSNRRKIRRVQDEAWRTREQQISAANRLTTKNAAFLSTQPETDVVLRQQDPRVDCDTLQETENAVCQQDLRETQERVERVDYGTWRETARNPVIRKTWQQQQVPRIEYAAERNTMVRKTCQKDPRVDCCTWRETAKNPAVFRVLDATVCI